MINKAHDVLIRFTSNTDLISQKSGDHKIPQRIIKNARGIAFLTTVKAGFIFTWSVATGIVLAKDDQGRWSGPSSIGSAGMGWGAQIGANVTDTIIILNEIAAVKAFSGSAAVKFGGDLSVAIGPLGREADANLQGSTKGAYPCFSYSRSQGLFAGISLQGSVLAARKDENRRFYRRVVSPRQILSGEVQPPPHEGLSRLVAALERAQGPQAVLAGTPFAAPEPAQAAAVPPPVPAAAAPAAATNPFAPPVPQQQQSPAPTYGRYDARNHGTGIDARTPNAARTKPPEPPGPPPPFGAAVAPPAAQNPFSSGLDNDDGVAI